MSNPFTKHPRDIGETYLQHMREALLCSVRMFYSSIACFIHAFLPFVFVHTASNCVKYLVSRFNSRFSKRDN
jgi:hypothetical protein